MKILPSNIRLDQLEKEVVDFLGRHSFWDERQISLQSVTGDNDWFCSVGKIHSLDYREKAYSVLNKDLNGTYIAELINEEYKEYYRWRMLLIPPHQHYSVHSDLLHNPATGKTKENRRIHIPVISNPDAFFCYFDDKPEDGTKTTVEYYNLQPGKVYEVNTSRLHSAVNYGDKTRIHLVGVRYE